MPIDKIESSDIFNHIVQLIDNNTIQLPSIPNVIMRIEQAVDDENLSMNHIANIIQNDTTLSARILQISNSAALRGHTKIISIRDAISRIGLMMVKNLIITIYLRDRFKSKDEKLNKFLAEVFDHSINISHFAYQVSERNRKLGFNSDLVHLAGIIYNLGKLPIISYYEEHPYNSIDEVKAIAAKHRIDLNKVILQKWEINAEISTTAFKTQIQFAPFEIGDLLLIVDAFLKKDTTILKASNPKIKEIWTDLETNYKVDMRNAEELKNSLLK